MSAGRETSLEDPGNPSPARSLEASGSPKPPSEPALKAVDPETPQPPETANLPAANLQNANKDVLSLMERVALDPTADVEKLSRMMDLYERMQANQSRQIYADAMNRAQDEIQPVARTTENTVTRSWYAKLEAVDAAIRPIYLKHGFALSYNTVPPLVEGNIRMECRCWHVSGHSELFYREAGADTLGPKGSPTKTVLHGLGSTETFLKRYLACGVFNVVFKNQDDDGNGGTLHPDEVDQVIELMKRAGSGPKFLKYMNAQSVQETGSVEASVATIAARDYRKAIAALEELIAKASAKAAHASPA